MNQILRYSLVIAVMISVASIASAENKKTGSAKMSVAVKQDAMAAMQKAASPNENHKVLEAFIGNWNYSGKMWMVPGQAPQEFTGTHSNQWIMGGRFLQQQSKGDAMGQVFEGLGITGYDNLKQEYISIWIDNMSTSMMKAAAQYDAASKTFSEKGSFSCAMTGEKDKAMRAAWTILDNDRYSYTMYFTDPSGQEFKSMEIQYTRAK